MRRRHQGHRVRLGVVGLGGMGQGHCRAMQSIDEVALAAVCDMHAPTARLVGTSHDVPHFSSPTDLYQSGLCDAVLQAAPHPVRPPLVIAAFEAGLHVLSEKPISECIGTADETIAAAQRMDLAYAVMFQRRTESVFRKARQLVDTGQIGRIHRTNLTCIEYRSQAYYDAGGWRGTWVGEGGGVLINQAPHLLDIFVWLAGLPDSVYARTSTRLHSIHVEDTAEALLTYSDGGTGYLYCSTAEHGPGEMIEIYGDQGKLCYRDGRLTLHRFEPSVAEFTASNTDMWAAPKCSRAHLRVGKCSDTHATLIRNFARHILGHEELVCPAEEAAQSLELANAIWLSADRSRSVRLPISRRDYDQFLTAKRRQFPNVATAGDDMRITDPGGRK